MLRAWDWCMTYPSKAILQQRPLEDSPAGDLALEEEIIEFSHELRHLEFGRKSL